MRQPFLFVTRLVLAVIPPLFLGACTVADYADGINGFSQAVTEAGVDERDSRNASKPVS